MTAARFPFHLLTEDADEKTVADIIGAGTGTASRSRDSDGATLVRTIHNTGALHSLRLEQQSAEIPEEAVAGC